MVINRLVWTFLYEIGPAESEAEGDVELHAPIAACPQRGLVMPIEMACGIRCMSGRGYPSVEAGQGLKEGLEEGLRLANKR